MASGARPRTIAVRMITQPATRTGEGVVAHGRGQARSLPRGGTFELRCSSCSYGVVVQIAPEACPMCRGTVWEHPRRASGVVTQHALSEAGVMAAIALSVAGEEAETWGHG